MALDVVVVGAGVAGITAATALAQAGHKVTVVEKSGFANEAGAALNLTPNGSRVLQQLGFDLESAGAVAMDEMQRSNGTSLDAVAPAQRLGAGYYAIHRGDLHSGLMRLAQGRVVLHLGAAVVAVRVETGRVVFVDGTELTADVVVGADGVHSVVRQSLGARLLATTSPYHYPAGVGSAPAELPPAPEPEYSGCAAYRFLLPTSLFEQHKHLLQPPPLGCMRLYIDPTDASRRRHLMWYACRNGTLQNFVAIHPIAYHHLSKLDANACKAHLLREFAYCHAQLRTVMEMAENVRLWPLFTMTPLPRWSSGRAILIGDAAHPMLPFSGQGANQAIEDAGALAFLLSQDAQPGDLQQILARFERVRVKRASRVQMMSDAVAGWELDVQHKVAPYCEDGIPVPTNVAERFAHDALFDVYEKCNEVMSA